MLTGRSASVAFHRYHLGGIQPPLQPGAPATERPHRQDLHAVGGSERPHPHACKTSLVKGKNPKPADDFTATFLYDTDDGWLFYDQDGFVGGSVHFATLVGAPNLDAGDIGFGFFQART